MNALIGRRLDAPPEPEIDQDEIAEAEEILLRDSDFLAAFVMDNDDVYKFFEREVLKKAAELHDARQEAIADAEIGNRDEE
jgi:hypothetical protein